jgi:ABC-2 type transport system permease protein
VKTLLRVLAVTGKELVEAIRRPAALGSIVLGPLIILGFFGFGFVGQPTLRAIVVIPAGSGLPTDLATYQQGAGATLEVAAITADESGARAALAAGTVDLVIVAPAGAAAAMQAGQHPVLTVDYDTISPYQAFVAVTAAQRLADAVNAQLVAGAVGAIESRLAAAGQTLPPGLQPELVAAPLQAQAIDLAPSMPAIVPFYGLGVLALIVQHVGVTLSALAMLRDRRRGLVELFRISPVRSGEMLVGKYLAAGALTGLVTLAVTLALVAILRVPLLGDPVAVAAAFALLIFAATGLGLLIALVADSERQVVQLALLLLLASVFFGGLAIDLTQFAPVVQIGAQVLPVTEAARLLQDLFLRGATGDPWRFAVLLAMGLALFALSAWRLRRVLASSR